MNVYVCQWRPGGAQGAEIPRCDWGDPLLVVVYVPHPCPAPEQAAYIPEWAVLEFTEYGFELHGGGRWNWDWSDVVWWCFLPPDTSQLPAATSQLPSVDGGTFFRRPRTNFRR